MTTKDEIMESVKRTGEAVNSEMFCLELATILCAPQYCGTIDVGKCITRPNKYILIKYLSTGNKLHICMDNGDVEVRVVDEHDNLMKSIVPECQTVLRNAIITHMQHVKALKACKEKEAMEAVSAEVDAEVAAIAGNPFHLSQEKPDAPACDETPVMAPVSEGIAAGGITIPPMPTEDRIGLAKVLLAAMESAMKADKEGKAKKPGKSKKGGKQGKTVAVIVKSAKDGKAKQPKKNK